MKIYEIISALENLDFIDHETGEVNQEKLESLNMQLDTKIDNIACYIKNLNAEISAIKEEEKKLEARRKAKEKKVSGLKQYVMDCMILADRDKFETSRTSLSFRKSKSINILDESNIPSQFKEVIETTKIDKVGISNAIKNGQEIHGAEMVENINLQIK